MAPLAAFDDSESVAQGAKQQALDMFQAETGRLPEGIKSVSDQANTIVQQVQVRKEQLPYDVCPRCGFGIGWMACRFHEGHAYMWCKAGRKKCPYKESKPIQPAASSSAPSTPERKRGSAYVDAMTPPKPSSAPRLASETLTYL